MAAALGRPAAPRRFQAAPDRELAQERQAPNREVVGAPGVTRTPGTQFRKRSGGTATSIISRVYVCGSRQVAAGNATQAQPATCSSPPAGRFHVGAKHSVHAAQVSSALLPKPLQHVAIQTKVYGSFSRARHDHVSVLPKIRVNLADRGVGTCARLAARP